MRTPRSARRATVAMGALLLTAVPAAAADSLSESVEQFLNNTQTKIEETKIWKLRIKPTLHESVIWTDNIYLNAADENPVTLTRVLGPGATVVTDPAQLARIASTIPDFEDTATQGRESDFIFQSELGTDLVLPVNEKYSKAFDKLEQMTLLGVKVRNQEYLDHNELDNNSVFLRTDVFSFINDLLNQQWGNNVWVRMSDEYSDLNDPLDASIRLLQSGGISTVDQFTDFGRKENLFNLDAGWNGAKVDASMGYERYNLWLNDESLQQADHVRQNFHAEVGSLVPGWEQQRAYLRYDVTLYHFGRADVLSLNGDVNSEQILNDATVQKGSLGVEGPMISDKTLFLAEAAYENWNPNTQGLSADTTSYAGFLGHFRAAYKPWEEQNTTFSFEYQKSLDYSAISNFNKEHTGLLSVRHEIIPKRLDGDFNISLTTTSPSDGPDRKLLETGCGLTYHVFKQFDVSLRYVFRHQTARNEIVTSSAFGRGARVFEYQVASDSEFYQNIVELGFLLHF